MIRNEREYELTKVQSDKFSRALADANAHSSENPLLDEIERKALRSQLDDLNRELAQYEAFHSTEGSATK